MDLHVNGIRLEMSRLERLLDLITPPKLNSSHMKNDGCKKPCPSLGR